MVQCSSCGQKVPRDKAKKVTKFVTMVQGTLGHELRKQGAYMPRVSVTKWYCISCSVHRGICSQRSKDERRFQRGRKSRK